MNGLMPEAGTSEVLNEQREQKIKALNNQGIHRHWYTQEPQEPRYTLRTQTRFANKEISSCIFFYFLSCKGRLLTCKYYPHLQIHSALKTRNDHGNTTLKPNTAKRLQVNLTVACTRLSDSREIVKTSQAKIWRIFAHLYHPWANNRLTWTLLAFELCSRALRLKHKYLKIPKLSPAGLQFSKRLFEVPTFWGLYTEGNYYFKVLTRVITYKPHTSFSLTWSTAIQTSRNKRKFLHEKRF